MRTIFLATGIMLAGCVPSDREIYTLYRNSILGADLRIHVATFNAKEGAAYNQENCRQAADLFQGQPGVKTRFWCEQGPYKS